MAGIPAGKDACSVANSAGYYERRRPDQTLLYQIIEQHYPVFSALMAEQGRELPGYVQREFGRSCASLRPRHSCVHARRRPAGRQPLAFGPLARAPPQGELPGFKD